MAVEAPKPAPNLEELSTLIAGHEARFAALTEAETRYRVAEREAYRLRDEANFQRIDLRLEQDNLLTEREKVLREQLASEGLAICTEARTDIEPYNHHHWQYEDGEEGGGVKDSGPLNRYGVFPKGEMVMTYSRSTYQRMSGDHYQEELVTYGAEDFSILCPQHAPASDRENYSRPSRFGDQYGPDEWTRVVEKDGQLIRELDGAQIYYPPRQGYVDSALYEHFGYPQIPPLPKEVR